MNGKSFHVSPYWQCQLTGWSLAAIFWNFNAWMDGGFNVGIALVHFILDVAIGIGITHGYRGFAMAKKWRVLGLRQLPARLAPAVIITGIIYMVAVASKNYAVRAVFNRYFDMSFNTFFQQNAWTLLTTGIRLMAIWILAFHLYHYALWQIQTAKENAQLLLAAKDSQLDNLSSQLNPHFLFNSLNTIKALVAEDPDKARRAIDLLSELLRTSLYRRDGLLIPLSHELSLVNDYFELEKIRFEGKFFYQLHVDNGLGGFCLLLLSIQTLAENAIKHGIAKYADGGMVSIRVDKLVGHIKITVQNPGLLLVDDSAGLGLKNLRNRLSLQYGSKASLELTQLSGDTVSAVMLIPAP